VENFTIQYAFVCDDVRQEVNNKVTYVGQSDVIILSKLPAMLPKLCIVYSTMGNPGKYKVTASINHKESGIKLLEIPAHDIEIKNKDQKIREIYQLHNVKIEKIGKYEVRIFYDGKPFYTFFFQVSNAPPQKGRGTGPYNMPIILSQN